MPAIPNVLRSYLLPLFENWVLASRSSNFETTRPIAPKIVFHSVQLLLLMTASFFLITSTSFLIRFLTYSSPSCKEEIKATVRLLSSCWDRNKTLNYCAIQVLKLGYTGVPIINANNNENCSLLLKKYTADSNPLVSPISNLNIKLNYAVQFSFRSLANNFPLEAWQTISPFQRILAVWLSQILQVVSFHQECLVYQTCLSGSPASDTLHTAKNHP